MPAQYEIFDIIESQNEQLKIPTLTLIEKIPVELEAHPIRSAFIMAMIIAAIIIVMHYLIKICKLYNAYQLGKTM